MNTSDWVLDTDWELLTVETLWVAHKFSTIVLESSYTRFLSFPQPAIICLLKIKKEIIVTPGHRGDPLKNYHSIGKKNRYLASCSFRGKCLVQGVAT
jgi:hypothetical protein